MEKKEITRWRGEEAASSSSPPSSSSSSSSSATGTQKAECAELKVNDGGVPMYV